MFHVVADSCALWWAGLKQIIFSLWTRNRLSRPCKNTPPCNYPCPLHFSPSAKWPLTLNVYGTPTLHCYTKHPYHPVTVPQEIRPRTVWWVTRNRWNDPVELHRLAFQNPVCPDGRCHISYTENIIDHQILDIVFRSQCPPSSFFQRGECY